jgi:hypothetical protein
MNAAIIMISNFGTRQTMNFDINYEFLVNAGKDFQNFKTFQLEELFHATKSHVIHHHMLVSIFYLLIRTKPLGTQMSFYYLSFTEM